MNWLVISAHRCSQVVGIHQQASPEALLCQRRDTAVAHVTYAARTSCALSDGTTFHQMHGCFKL